MFWHAVCRSYGRKAGEVPAAATRKGDAMKVNLSTRSLGLALPVLLLLAVATPALAADIAGPTAAISGIDTVWVLMGAFFVFFMQAGFGMVEAGFIRSKNSCNILTKNFMDYCTASIMYFFVGYAFMFGEGNGFIGLSNFGLTSSAGAPDNVPIW